MAYYDHNEALLDRRAFARSSIFKDELCQIFECSWLFVGPEDWVAEPRQYFTARAGTNSVIVWRGRSGALHLIDNACLHCMRTLAGAERGAADYFACSCSSRRYDEVEAAQMLNTGCLESYNGLLFASRGKALPFRATLGEFEPYLRRLTHVRIIGDTAVRWRVPCNWKLAVEAGCGVAESEAGLDGFQVATETGAAVFAEDKPFRAENDDLPTLRPLAGALFPNLTFEHHASAIHVWSPVEPDLTEVQSFCIAPMDGDADDERQSLRAFMSAFGGFGTAGGRSLEAWSAITRSAGSAVFSPLWLNIRAGRESERRSNLPGIRGALTGETNARAFYSWWQGRLGSEVGAPTSHSFPRQKPNRMNSR